MLSDKVFLTYKRRRSSFQTDITHDTKATNLSPNMPRGSSWITSPEYGCDACEEKFNNHDPENLQCPNCNRIYGYDESLQQHVSATKRMKQNQITGQSDLGPILLHFRRVLSGAEAIEHISKASPSTEHACWSNTKDTIGMDISATEGGGYSSEHPEAGVKISQHSDNGDNALGNVDGGLNEKSRTPLITFSRRTKPKQDAVETIDKNLKVVEKQSFSAPCSLHAVGTSFSCEGSSRKHAFEEQMVNSKVDATSDGTAEIFPRLNIMQRVETSSEFTVPPTAADTCEELSKEFLKVQPVDVVKGYILSLYDEPSNAGHDFSLRGKESGNKLVTNTNLSENRTIPNMSGLRDCPAGMDPSFVPKSVCQMNLETDKHSNVVPENHREFQSSSTHCSFIGFIDEENDARNKELEWLESLDKILRERKKDKGKCSLTMPDGFDCRARSHTAKRTKSLEQSLDSKDIANNFVDQLSTSKKLSSANLPVHSCEEQQVKAKSAAFTDFFRPCLRSNPSIQMDLNSAVASSNSHYRNNLYMHDMQHPCSLYGTPSWLKHRLITENAITEMMLRGRQGYFSDKPKRFSSKWSEEELDFLWVGVRRHGINNWNAMLLDPKLHFAHSRFPEDLALQWEQEQKKLFSVILFPPAMCSKATTFSTPLFDGQCAAKYHAFADNPLTATETKLSLGDVYLHKDIPKSSQFNPPGFGISYPLTNENPMVCPLADSYTSASAYPGAAVRNQKSTSVSSRMYHWEYDCHERSSERSTHEQHPAGFSASSYLPRWLKEVCSSRPAPNVLSQPSCFTAGKATNSANNDISLCSPNTNLGEPLTSKDLRGRGILKRKSMVYGKNLGIRMVEEGSARVVDSVLGSNLSVTQTQNLDSERLLGAGLHKKYIAYSSDNTPVSVVPNDLVVIDSDASSEETLSDDQNSRL